MTTRIEGLVAAPLTGFSPDGSVNPGVVAAYAQMLRDDGVVGVFVNGTTGEGQSLTPEERMLMATAWIAEGRDDFKVIIHVTHPEVAVSCELAEHAQEAGAWAVGAMGPIGDADAKLPRVIDQVSRIAAAAPDLPCYYYHIPVISRIDIAVHDLLREAPAAIPTLAGVKFTYRDLAEFEACRRCEGGRYDMLFGRDEQLLAALAFGARGAVGSTYNFMAPLFYKLIDAFDAGRLEEARDLQWTAIRKINTMAATGNYFGAAKTEMKKRGINLGGTRP